MGFHNFYAGNYLSGGIKILLVMIGLFLDATTSFRTGFSLVAIALMAIWALLEIIFTTQDANGNEMT